MKDLVKQISSLISEYENANNVVIDYISLKRDVASGKRKVKTVFRGK